MAKIKFRSGTTIEVELPHERYQRERQMRSRCEPDSWRVVFNEDGLPCRWSG